MNISWLILTCVHLTTFTKSSTEFDIENFIYKLNSDNIDDFIKQHKHAWILFYNKNDHSSQNYLELFQDKGDERAPICEDKKPEHIHSEHTHKV